MGVEGKVAPWVSKHCGSGVCGACKGVKHWRKESFEDSKGFSTLSY